MTVSSLKKLEEGELPTKEDFDSSLYNSDISREDYQHARNVCFDIIADVFENFRDNCLEAYGLDPAHYYTTPGLTWDAMLKYTKVELEMLTDIDMPVRLARHRGWCESVLQPLRQGQQ